MRNFKRIISARPGRDLKRYNAYHLTTTRDKRGNAIESYDLDKPFLTFTGVISRASQKEKVHYEQLGHNVTHEIIVYRRVPIKAGDLIVRAGRKFYVHDIRDPGEIGLMFCIMTEERQSEGRV